jgi:hypothetical protein
MKGDEIFNVRFYMLFPFPFLMGTQIYCIENIINNGMIMPGTYKYDRKTRERNQLRLKNERDLHVKLEQWRRLDETDMLIVHCVSPQYFDSAEFNHFEAESVFKRWDVISASLITHQVKYGGKDGKVKYTGMYGELGFVLDVPPQNILGTHYRDVYFPNHIGTPKYFGAGKYKRKEDSWKLADATFSGVGKNIGIAGFGHDKAAWPINEGNPYNIIEAPIDILFKSNRARHNEILIIGKPGVSLHHGYPPSQEIKVKAIIVGERNSDSNFTSLQRKHELDVAIEKLSKANPGLRVINI